MTKSITLYGPNGKPLRERSRPDSASEWQELRARYDAAIKADESANHWANADGLSAMAANDPETRRVLRERARYEVSNNTYASGMVETLANDVIGTGPRLQIETEDDKLNERINDEFEWWTEAVGLAEILRTDRESRAVDGEGIMILGLNPAIDSPVKLSIDTIEGDQLATPDLFLPGPREVNGITYNFVDGIVFDRYKNPAEYHVLKQHPGDLNYVGGSPWEYDRYPAHRVIHWFKKRRPGQVRGIPEITAALPLFAMLRRYTLAVLSAAEIAALFAVLLKSNLPPDVEDVEPAPGMPPFAKKELVRGMMTVLPDGYSGDQMKPEQPTTTYPAFKHEIIGEAGRVLNMPFNVSSGNSSGYNYASGRLDHQVYHRAIGVDRYHAETAVLNRILSMWLTLWLASEGRGEELAGSNAYVRPVSLRYWPHQWFWDGFTHVDPGKEAKAQETRLGNGTTTIAREYAAEGLDWRAQVRQAAEERAYYASHGVPYPGDAAKATNAAPGRQPAMTDDGGDDDE